MSRKEKHDKFEAVVISIMMAVIIITFLLILTGCTTIEKRALEFRQLAETLEIAEGSVAINGFFTTTSGTIKGEKKDDKYRVTEYTANIRTMSGQSVTIDVKKTE